MKEAIYISDLAAWCTTEFISQTSNPLWWSDTKRLFLNGKELRDLVIPSDVTNISPMAFNECYSLRSLTIPDHVTSIGDLAFCCCPNLTGSLVIPDSVTHIGKWALRDNGFTSITFPSKIPVIGEFAFSGCKNLKSFTIPDSVTSIGRDAFSFCESLVSIVIPDSVKRIGSFAFTYCEKLEVVKLPSHLFETVLKDPDEFFLTPHLPKNSSGAKQKENKSRFFNQWKFQ